LHTYLGGTQLIILWIHCFAIVLFGFQFSVFTKLNQINADVEDTRHRTAFLDAGATFNLPLFSLQGTKYYFSLSSILLPHWLFFLLLFCFV
jgi:hypothetical protein